MPDRTRLPPQARILRTAFFAAYWSTIVALLVSLGIEVIGGQVHFWSVPAGVAVDRDPARCLPAVRRLAAELDAGIASALGVADRTPSRALPAFRRFAHDWETRWQTTRASCGLATPPPSQGALAEAHGRLLERRYSAETFVRRYAAGEGRDRARISEALARASGVGQ